jgi:hypothetical protein
LKYIKKCTKVIAYKKKFNQENYLWKLRLVFFEGSAVIPGNRREKSKALQVLIHNVLIQKQREECPIHVVTFTLMSILITDYIQKRRGQALRFSFEYNLLPNLISK